MAKTLADYPVSYPFGATTWPYSPQFPHHGDDIAAPSATDIIVRELKLGEVGSTGDSTGPHTHIDKSKNLNAGPYVKPSDWKEITGVVIFAGDLGTAGLTVIVEADNGYFYRFLHMSKITAKVGDIIGGMYKGETAKTWYQRWVNADRNHKAELRNRLELQKQLKACQDNPPGDTSEIEKLLEGVISWVKSKWNKE